MASEPADGADSPVTAAPVIVPPEIVAVDVTVPLSVIPATVGAVKVLFVRV